MKKLLSLLLAILMLFTICVGCSSSDLGDDNTTDSAGGTTDTAEATETPATTADEADIYSWILEDDTSISGTVRFWMPFKGDQGMDDMIAEFNETYPNIKVELTTYNNNADGNLSVNTAIMSGEVDVLASFGLSNAYTRWENDLYIDITDKVEEDGIDLVANWGSDVYTYDGSVYTLPCGGLSFYVSINMTAWDEAGLGELPTEWTWDEYLAACEAMTEYDANGATIVYGGSDFQSANYFTYVKYQVTGSDQYYNLDTGLSSFDSDLIINSLAREVQAENVDGIWFPKSVYRADNIQAQQVYASGQVASAIGPNMVRFIRDTENYPMDWVTGFAPYPTEEEGQTNHMSGVSNFSHAGITTGCQDEDAAWAFLEWYSTYGSKYLVIAGHQSAWRGTESNDIVSLIFGSEETAAALIDVDSFKRVVGVTSNPSYVDTVLTAYSEVSDYLTEYTMYAINGEMTAQEAMTEAAALANEAINAAG